MAMYYCEGCNQLKDDDWDLATEIDGEWYCEHCAGEYLTAPDWYIEQVKRGRKMRKMNLFQVIAIYLLIIGVIIMVGLVW